MPSNKNDCSSQLEVSPASCGRGRFFFMSSNSRVWISLVKLALAVNLVAICESIDVSVGQTAILPCHNNIQGTVQVVWKDKELKTLSVNEDILSDDRRFSIQHKYQNDWDLQISGVKLSDTGNYTCCFVLTNDCQTIAIVTLAIQIPPSILSVSNDVTIQTGGKATLVCNATGTPKPTIKWLLYQLNVPTKELNSTEVYSIVDAQIGDAGRYECVASNGVLPTASRSVQVSITFKPQVTVPYREVRQTLNVDTLLECHIRSNPVGEYYWEKNGRRLDNQPEKYRISSWKGSDETETLFVLVVYKLNTEDFAYYTCVAKNQFGTAMESAQISAWHNGTLRMLSSPRDTVAQVGQSITFDCTMEGMGKADQLVWWRQESVNGRYIMLFNSTVGRLLVETVGGKRKYGIIGQYNLEVKTVAAEDGGLYCCHVSGLGNFTASLAVVAPDSSIGSGCGKQTSGIPTMITVAIVVSVVVVFIIVFVVVVLAIVRHYRSLLNKRPERSTVVKTERYSNLNPNSSYM